MRNTINIALVDDEALFVEGLSLLFSNEEHINVTTKSNSGLGLLEALGKKKDTDFPDIALVDIQMKPMDGFALVEALKQTYPDLKIIILSSHYKNNVLGHMVQLGVSAFIPKNANKELLVKAIQSVHNSGVFFTQANHEMLIKYMNSRSEKITTLSAYEALSEREIEVLKLICLEHTNREIADLLFLSIRTIESHRQRILEKVGARNTVGLVIYAVANQIHHLPRF